MLFVNTFEYDGIKSAKYGLFFGHVDTERLKQICGNLEYNQVFYPSLNRQEIHGVNKDEFPLSFDVEIISAEPISYWSAKDIKKWLFNSPTYKRLYASSVKDKTIEKINGEIKRRYVECVFTNPEAMFYADGLHGWKCTCILSSGWAFQDEIEITYTDFTESITISVDSDNGEYIYPTFTFSATATTNPISPTIDNFRVSSDGFLFCNNANITGTLQAGSIIGGSAITNNNGYCKFDYLYMDYGGVGPFYVQPKYLGNNSRQA